jgi:hypothetical protein
MKTPPPGPTTTERCRRPISIAVYRTVLRLYPKAFRDRWADETLLLFAEVVRRQPNGLALWNRHLPDLAGGLLAEWWRECRLVSWLISAAALAVTALSGRSTRISARRAARARSA